jgi:hypothetical protein
MGFVRNVVGGITGSTQADAARRAATIQAQAADKAIAEQSAAREQATAFLRPYQEAGLSPLSDLYGIASGGVSMFGIPEARLMQFAQAPTEQGPPVMMRPGVVPAPESGGRATGGRLGIGMVSRPVLADEAAMPEGAPTFEMPFLKGTPDIFRTDFSALQRAQQPPAQMLPALPGVEAPDVGPLPTLQPGLVNIPGLAPIQGALPGVSLTAPTGLPALQPSQRGGLPAIPAVGGVAQPGVTPLAGVGPAVTPTAQMGPALTPTAQMGPAIAPTAPAGLPAIGGDIAQDSLFQALKREAISGIESSAAARGKLFSGTTPQAIAEKVQNIALARAGDIQAQNIAARQQLTAEAQQQFGQQLAARQLGGTEQERIFAQQVAARGLAGTEAERTFAQQVAARGLTGTEQERAFAQQLAAQQFGVGQGAQAFQQALAARQQLMGEQGQVFGETAQARQLGSAEAQQQFAQQMALRQLAGAETGDIFGRSLAAQQAAAALQGQTFGQSLAARQALLAQQQQQQAANLAIRGQLIGERGQLFSQDLAARQAMLGERVAEQERAFQQRFNIAQLGQAAAAGQAANVQAAAGNIGGLLTQQANAIAAGQVGAANARAQFGQGLVQAGTTLGAAAILAPVAPSDRRIKTDIVRIGAMDNGLPLYSFRYKGKSDVHMGVMAQDVEKVKPEAVIEINGVKHVNYGAL